MTRTGTLLLLTLAMACPASAHTVVIEGGKVHLALLNKSDFG
ncbi:hypothetical protein [Enterobacter roggenkampii]